MQKGTPRTAPTPWLLLTLNSQSSASLLLRYHILDREIIDGTFSLLQQLAAYRVEVRPLSSGKSGAVSGEVVAGSWFTNMR